MITGDLEADGRDLVLSRTVPAARDLLWEYVSAPELLASWFGTFIGDPSSGHVMVTMNAEPGEVAATLFTIHECVRHELLTVSSVMGADTWRLSLELVDATESGEEIVGTRVRLRHHDVPIAMLEHVGPGWEWYLDRLIGAVTGGDVPGMDVWDSQYMVLSGDYAALAR